MGGVRTSRKRPCRICRKWFVANPRVGDRQKTCGSDECRKRWHVKKCREWNGRNREYFQAIYLARKLSRLSEQRQGARGEPSAVILPSRPRLLLGLPRREVQEVIGTQALVIIEYISQLLLRRFQEVIPP
jgi:hypothetical protein